MSKRDWEQIHKDRQVGVPWETIAQAEGVSRSSIRGQYSRWRANLAELRARGGVETPEKTVDLDLSAIRTLDQLVATLEVDEDEWEVSNFRAGMREKHTLASGVTNLASISASFRRKQSEEALEAVAYINELIGQAAIWAPQYETPNYYDVLSDNPATAFINIYDPHIGMLAWGPEVGGESQDLKTIIREYDAAVGHLLSMTAIYPVEEIVYVVGHDFLHADQPGENNAGGRTTKGTSLDMDGRLHKIFEVGKEALVRGIDRARLMAPVKVIVVPGNHDHHSMLRMGSVLDAWYRNDDVVTVDFGPNKRRFHGYGKNAYMLTHGEELTRQRDNLVTIFASECPPELWAYATYREVLTGHNHRLSEGGYHPTSEASESRGVRVISLPGMTNTDKWHHQEGYKHHRAATLRVYSKAGGVLGSHEFTP